MHNNHHAFATSARLSNKWYEFDIGWLYICILQVFGLAKVKKTAPKLRMNKQKDCCDLDTLQAVISHRYEVLAKYTKSLQQAFTKEMDGLKGAIAEYDIDKSTLKRWVMADSRTLQAHEKEKLSQVLSSAQARELDKMYVMREELIGIWQRSTASTEELVKQLEDWCKRAEESGIEVLRTFSQSLRCYA